MYHVWGLVKDKILVAYIKGIIDMPKVIGANRLNILQTWINSSYAIYQDMRGHMGGVLSMGHGIIHGKGTKENLNTKSSTKTEVIGAIDYMQWKIWAKRFLQHQGYELKRKNTLSR